MYGFVNSGLGWFHLCTAVLALVLGTFVLGTRKGTRLHRRVGYLYVGSMVLVCGSALAIYNLTGRFGVFHVAALVGFVTLLGGMTPMVVKGIDRQYRELHVWFMYYSVLGLYAAFASELSVRIPDRPFYTLVALATGAIMTVGTLVILRKQKVWTRPFRS